MTVRRWSGAAMCQASKCGLRRAAGRYGDMPTWCRSDSRARSSLTALAFQVSTSPISLPLPCLDLLHRRRIAASGGLQAAANADPR